MITITEIKETLEEVCKENRYGVKHIEEAIESLKAAKDALETVSVRGRHDVDALLGCMIGLDMIIGEEKDGRQNNK